MAIFTLEITNGGVGCVAFPFHVFEKGILRNSYVLHIPIKPNLIGSSDKRLMGFGRG